MIRIDCHLHSKHYSMCSIVDPVELVLKAEEKGIDLLVFTEHDRFWTEKDLEKINRVSDKVTVLNGVELSAWKCHILAFGLPASFPFNPGEPLDDLMTKLHEYDDIAVVPAHPFRFGKENGDRLQKYTFPALEGYSLNTFGVAATYARDFASERNIPLIAASDLHDLDSFGYYWSESDTPLTTMSEFVRAVNEGRIRAASGMIPEAHPL